MAHGTEHAHTRYTRHTHCTPHAPYTPHAVHTPHTVHAVHCETFLGGGSCQSAVFGGHRAADWRCPGKQTLTLKPSVARRDGQPPSASPRGTWLTGCGTPDRPPVTQPLSNAARPGPAARPAPRPLPCPGGWGRVHRRPRDSWGRTQRAGLSRPRRLGPPFIFPLPRPRGVFRPSA